jgi:hypothetical protein
MVQCKHAEWSGRDAWNPINHMRVGVLLGSFPVGQQDPVSAEGGNEQPCDRTAPGGAEKVRFAQLSFRMQSPFLPDAVERALPS